MSVDSYTPLQNGIATDGKQDVYYSEHKPSNALAGIVHCFWTLKTATTLKRNFIYTVMPDACIDIIFDVREAADPIIMTPTIAIETVELGKEFHYIGIRFKPGVFKDGVDIKSIIGHQKSLISVLKRQVEFSDINLHISRSEQEQYDVLDKFARKLVDDRIVERNNFIENVLRGMQSGLTVNEVAIKVGYSSRQLQRKVSVQTGYSPIQLKRIVRFQSVLSSGDHGLKFADQSHLIKEFKAVTGVSYANFTHKYIDVRKIQS